MEIQSSHKLSTTSGGNTPFSYVKNSSFQRGAFDSAKDIIAEAIAEKLEISNSNSNLVRVADFGCSVGPNTLSAVKAVVEAAKLRFRRRLESTRDAAAPEFQVFFNDHIDNDFNALFRGLPPPPPSGTYFVAAVPGSFHGRLFPAASLHVAVSSYSLQWLSRVPPPVTVRGTAAFNGGSVHCTGFNEGVAAAYSAQFGADMEAFLEARAAEVAGGGLMTLLLLGLPDGVLLSQTTAGMTFDLLGLCLQDMAKEGLVTTEKVDFFNLPLYYVSIGEMERLVEKNGCFTIERMEPISQPIINTSADVQTIVSHLRATMEGLIKEHFGNDILEDLFKRFAAKLTENYFIHDAQYRKNIYLFLLLKHKGNMFAVGTLREFITAAMMILCTFISFTSI